MKNKFCIECKNIIPISKHYSTKKYCCKKCEGRWRRKQPGYKEQMNRLRKDWQERNKEKRLVYCREWEHKNYLKRKLKTDKWKLKNPEYHKKYHYKEKSIKRETAYRKTGRYKELNKIAKERFNLNHPGYWREIFNKNPERAREQHKKYRYSPKGIATFYKIYDKKRRRNYYYLGKKMDYPNENLITMLKERDKTCFYCNREFDLSSPKSKGYPSLDHINPELPLIEVNSVICCKYCNSSKKKNEVLSWLKKKGYKPSKVLLELLNKQKEYLSQ